MCKVQIPQEESDKILAVGQKMRYEGKEAVITDIRAWHDLGLSLVHLTGQCPYSTSKATAGVL